ncbi:MAG: hypothetical protein AVDCRST_MAG67-3885, partial [uncultured Solirubrobacteraceae bacterium]
AELGGRRRDRDAAAGGRGRDVLWHGRAARARQGHVPHAHEPRRAGGARHRHGRARGAAAGRPGRVLHDAALRRLAVRPRAPGGRRSRRAGGAARGCVARVRRQAGGGGVGRRAGGGGGV